MTSSAYDFRIAFLNLQRGVKCSRIANSALEISCSFQDHFLGGRISKYQILCVNTEETREKADVVRRGLGFGHSDVSLNTALPVT